VIGVAMDITDRKLAEQRIAHMAHHDALTGLPNRVLLRDRIQQAIAQAHRNDTQLAVLFLDLDRFKTINDEFGHRGGDQVLVQFAQRIRALAPLEDLVVRLGGDEFAILSLAPRSVAQSGAFAARLVREATDPIVLEMPDGSGGTAEQMVRIGVSVGVAHADSAHPGAPETSLDALLSNADGAMYWAKERGRGRAEHHALLGAPAVSAGFDPARLTQARRGPAAPSV